jgi:hypothetical protein
MKLSNAQLRLLKYLKDHNHPYDDPAYWGGRLKIYDDMRSYWPQTHKVSERTLLRLWVLGLVEFPRHAWEEARSRSRSAFLRATVRLTPKGLDAWLENCELKPEYRSL